MGEESLCSLSEELQVVGRMREMQTVIIVSFLLVLTGSRGELQGSSGHFHVHSLAGGHGVCLLLCLLHPLAPGGAQARGALVPQESQ